MRQEIEYKTSDEVKKLIQRWQDWLRDERCYSPHTVDGYSRDLSLFFNFTYEYFNERLCSLSDLKKLDVRDFRAFLSYRNAKYIEKSSLARELSTLRSFFKWLNRNKIIENTAISIISSPRKPKILPKSLDIQQTFKLLKNAAEFEKKEWQGLRDVAIFTILYGCGLRISEALSLNAGDRRLLNEARAAGEGNCYVRPEWLKKFEGQDPQKLSARLLRYFLPGRKNEAYARIIAKYLSDSRSDKDRRKMERKGKSLNSTALAVSAVLNAPEYQFC